MSCTDLEVDIVCVDVSASGFEKVESPASVPTLGLVLSSSLAEVFKLDVGSFTSWGLHVLKS